MSEWKELTDESRERWEQNAEHWDDYMGEESNRFHRELIRPYTEKLLNIKAEQTILDIACGNGNFSKRLAELGAKVVAFDYSPKMTERAKIRTKEYKNQIDYKVIDATSYEQLSELGNEKFDSAVANMALMDIADIRPLVNSLHKMLKPDGIFIFSITHPCFQPPGLRKITETEDRNGHVVTTNSIQISKYLTSEPYKAIGIKGQSIPHLMFHRPLSYYMNLFFESNFLLDGMEEPSFQNETNKFEWHEIPPVLILRFRKVA
ncbi:class I SAM-dependent methyltransferase [Fredinandcohnia sp. QZ13]|uniref:class I SAM-dependent methyltransferase n=1 Tax=Fredinandcohnia sp. QZ13 TaxID=3073144 RepID=UPI002852FDF0|nr:class I SAM-dependent methyltransferase [Fredinandcohnia sp. QZ13]MDR4889777.1 class I SAM-dependent methyltransferase [Fredinandcohnia sp. QZ13]